MLTRTRETQPASLDSRSSSNDALGLLLVAFAAVAIGAAAWMLLGPDRLGGDRLGGALATRGDFAPVGKTLTPVPRRPHPLLAAAGAPAAWTMVRDGRALGRGASTVLEDVQTVLGNGPSRVAVPGARVSPNTIAWASPRSVRLVDLDARTSTAWVGTCDRGIDAVHGTGALLLTAACGQLTAVGQDGRTRWSVQLPEGSSWQPGRTLLLRRGDTVVAAVVGADVVLGVSSADGEVNWRHRTHDPVRLMAPSGSGGVVVATAPADSTAGGHTKVRRIAASDGSELWERRWRGWRATALVSDGARVVVALAQNEADTGCTPTGIAELAAANGATRLTRRTDARVLVRDMRVDPLTGRLVTMSLNRGCTLLLTDPRIDVYGARGFVRLHQATLPARPCSPLDVAGGIAVAATCSEVIGIDTRTGRTALEADLTAAPRRRSVAATLTNRRLVITDDVGSLQVIERLADR